VIGRAVAGVALALATGVATAQGPRLAGASFADGMLYDVDAATGAATNARQIRAYPCDFFCGDVSVAVTHVAGVEAYAATLLLVTTITNASYPSTLMGAPLADPLVAYDAVDPVGAQIGEGDLAIDPASHDLFAVGLTGGIAPFQLLRIHALTGASTVGPIGFSDVSGLAFDAAGTLYALDTGSDALLVLDPDDATTLSTTPLSEPLGAVAGMDWDPDTDTLYVADGGSGGRNALFTLDPDTGVLTEIGPLGIASGLSGLVVVPEPSGVAIGGVALAALAWLERRCA
jgi:DNA-binding beta-propeller fold protein YncE